MANSAEKTDQTLVDFVTQARGRQKLVSTNASNVTGVVRDRDREIKLVETPEGKVRVLQLTLSKAQQIVGQTAQRKTDGQVADEYWQGKQAYYEMYFLTGRARAAGTDGTFYIQLEGTFATTDLIPTFIMRKQGEWHTLNFWGIYVGEITKIRVAAGSPNGWWFSEAMVFYPRGYVRVTNELWVQSDELEGQVIEIFV